MDLANSISDPQVEICLVHNVNQRPLRMSSCSGRHRVVAAEHRHLSTNTPELFSRFLCPFHKTKSAVIINNNHLIHNMSVLEKTSVILLLRNGQVVPVLQEVLEVLGY